MTELTAEFEVAITDKDRLIDTLVYCIEMPEQTELERAEKRAYMQCLGTLGSLELDKKS